MFRVIIFLFIISSVMACTDEVSYQRGDIVGKIGYYEEEFYNFIDTLAGVHVVLEDMDGTIVETVTGVDGRFIFEDVTAGNYVVNISKENFASLVGEFFTTKPMKIPVTHTGGGATRVTSQMLYELPVNNTVFESYEWVNDFLIVNLSIPPRKQDAYLFTVFMNDSSTVSSKAYDYVYRSDAGDDIFYEPIVVDTLNGKVALKIPYSRSDGDVYMTICSASIWWYTLTGPASNTLFIDGD